MRTLILLFLSLFFLSPLDAGDNYEQTGTNGKIVAIPSSSGRIDAGIDDQFSRTSWFCLYNPVREHPGLLKSVIYKDFSIVILYHA